MFLVYVALYVSECCKEMTDHHTLCNQVVFNECNANLTLSSLVFHFYLLHNHCLADCVW